jgi:transposase
MYVARVPNRGSPPAVLLRESYREGGKVKNRTLANLSRWPPEKVEALSRVLKGLPAEVELREAFRVSRSLPHGHVAAALGTLRRLSMEALLDSSPSRSCDLVCALIVAAVIAPASKLATARSLRSATASSSLGELLSLAAADEDDLYAAMDWLLARKGAIEDRLAARHLRDGLLVLYDVSSAAFEGRSCPLGAIGYPRDGVRGRLQIVYGLLATAEGIPLAVEVFAGDTADPATLKAQIAKLKGRFRLSHICLVGDRGMITSARISEELAPAGLDWIGALRAPQIKALASAGELQLGLFDERDLLEIASPDYPGERLVCCRNPQLAAERARKREALLLATEAELAKIAAAVARASRPLRGKERIALRVGRIIDRYKVAKHFQIEIGEAAFSFRRNEGRIAAEARLDGVYVLRTSLDEKTLAQGGVVLSYKALENVERFFRGCNSELEVRPIRHRRPDRVIAHIFLRMLSYYLAWHMKQRLAPLLFAEEDRPGAQAARPSPVAAARRSQQALRKAARKRADTGEPLHSFASLLEDLATIALNTIAPAASGVPSFRMITTPTPLQVRAFELLGVSHSRGYT